jgi:hypothetical protein
MAPGARILNQYYPIPVVYLEAALTPGAVWAILDAEVSHVQFRKRRKRDSWPLAAS